MVRQAVVAATLVVALASGCGSGGSAATSASTTGGTAATGAASTTTPTTTTPTTSSTGSDVSAANMATFERFIVGVHKIALPAQAAWAHMNTAMGSFNPNESASWGATMASVKAAARASDRSANQLRYLHAPHSLATPFANYVVTCHKEATVLNQMAAALEAHDLSAISTWNSTAIPELNTDNTAAKHFDYTVLAFMSRNGLPLPSWAKQYGF